jgi:8-amino-7-oxononanoate synthase
VNFLEARVRERLADWEASGLLRSLRPPSGIDFSSNDYLNLAAHPSIVERLIEAAAREGCGSTGSRLLRGEREAFQAIERRFARFKGTEAALYFSSGYLANLAVLTTLAEQGDVIFSDDRNHASLIDGARLSAARRVVFPHNDVDELARLMGEAGDVGHRFVVVESLFSMDGDMAPLTEYARLCHSTGASLIVDEAHAVGMYGATGSGLLEECGVESGECISVNTAGKALGVGGAFVAGPAWVIDFVFSTAAPPALASALDASLDVIANEPGRRDRLAALARRLRAKLAEAGVALPAGRSQIISIVIGDNERAVGVANALQAKGFDVRAIRPPSVPPDTSRLRVSVNAGLSEETVDRFAASLADALREVGVCCAVSS